MPQDPVSQGPQIGEQRTVGAETRVWTGRSWLLLSPGSAPPQQPEGQEHSIPGFRTHAGNALMLGAGFLPGGPAIQGAIGGLSGAAASAMEGNSLGQIGKDAAMNAGLSVGGGVLGRKIPEWGTQIAQNLGGRFGWNKLKKGTEAFMRERSLANEPIEGDSAWTALRKKLQINSATSLGDQHAVDQARGQLGSQLQHAEEAFNAPPRAGGASGAPSGATPGGPSPRTGPLGSSVTGVSTPPPPGTSIGRPGPQGPPPPRRPGPMQSTGATPPGSSGRPGGPTSAPGVPPTVNLPPTSTPTSVPGEIDMMGLKGFADDLRLDPSKPITDRATVDSKVHRFITEQVEDKGKTSLSMREAGNMKRDFADRGKKIIGLGDKGKPVYSSEGLDEQFANAASNRLRDLQVSAEQQRMRQLGRANPMTGVVEDTIGPIQHTNSRIADLQTMGSVNADMGRNANFFGGIGTLTGRAALGGFAGGGIASLSGKNRGEGAAYGAAAGLGLLPPRHVSKMANVGGFMAEKTPTIVRLLNSYEDLKKQLLLGGEGE